MFPRLNEPERARKFVPQPPPRSAPASSAADVLAVVAVEPPWPRDRHSATRFGLRFRTRRSASKTVVGARFSGHIRGCAAAVLVAGVESPVVADVTWQVAPL